MREIKFRAWDEKGERFIERFMVSKNGEILGKDVETLNEPIFCWENVVLMQYTGLKADDGKEIYEGDLVSYTEGVAEPYTYIYEVKWNPETFRIDLFDLVGEWVYLDETAIDSVIGNIYENPELLK